VYTSTSFIIIIIIITPGNEKVPTFLNSVNTVNVEMTSNR